MVQPLEILTSFQMAETKWLPIMTYRLKTELKKYGIQMSNFQIPTVQYNSERLCGVWLLVQKLDGLELFGHHFVWPIQFPDQ
jgi:hypothetical protein